MSTHSPQSPNTPDTLSEAEARKIRILKAVVIGLGVLILLALFTLVLGLALGGKGSDEVASTSSAPGVSAPMPSSSSIPNLDPSMEEITIALPTSAKIQETTLYGNRLVIRWRIREDTRDHIWIIDIETGAVLRKLTQP